MGEGGLMIIIPVILEHRMKGHKKILKSIEGRGTLSKK